jgi:type IV secretory pathway VirB2 component (pilin)
MAGSMIFPQAAAQYKRQIQDVIIGLILVMVASFIVNSLGGG